MALGDFKLADVTIGQALVENWGRASPYFQRYLQDTNRQITLAIQTLIVQQSQIQQALDDAEDALEAVEALQEVFANLLFAMSLGSFGNATVTPDGSGNVTIAHGYVGGSPPVPPSLGACSVTPTGTTYFHPQMTGVDNTNLYLRLYDAAGLPITTGSYTVAYRVAGI